MNAPEPPLGERRRQRPFDLDDKSYTPQMWIDDLESLHRSGVCPVPFPNPLHHVAGSGRTDVLEVMLANGGDVNASDGEGCTLLQDAALMGRTGVVQALLAAGADVNRRCRVKDMSALDFAVVRGHADITEAILEHGVDTNASGANGNTPLHHAAAAGVSEMVTLLCVKGASPNTLNRRGRTPLQLAAVLGHSATIQALLASGADGNARNELDGMTALEHAVSGDHVDAATAIMEYGVDVNASGANSDGRTPLHIAAILGRTEMASLLCRKGANVNASSSLGKTPLFVAASSGRMGAVQVLLAAGADTSLRCSVRSMSALDIVVSTGHVDIARAIIDHGADVNAAGPDGRTPLHYAVAEGTLEMVRLLTSKGAEIDKVDGQRRTPLNIATMHGDTDTLRVVLAAGADVTLRCNIGFSPLDCAASQGHVSNVLVLIEHGADVNTSGSRGVTTLHVAALFNRPETIDVLVEAGAEVDRDADGGGTPLHFAAKSSSPAAVRALLQHGACVSKQSQSGETPLLGAAAMAGTLGTAEVVDLLLRRGANEKAITIDGRTVAGMVGSRVEEPDRVVEEIERARKLLANAPADRAWRRRGFLVMCRARYIGDRGHPAHRGDETHGSVAKRTRSHTELARGGAGGWVRAASMLIGVGTDRISLMGNGANLIIETIVGYL
ncbi:unnamed protein product [Scytosiphon promiscuus]